MAIEDESKGLHVAVVKTDETLGTYIRAVKNAGHTPHVFERPEDVLVEVTRNPEQFDVLLTGDKMPDAADILAKRIKEASPNLIICMVAYNDDYLASQWLAKLDMGVDVLVNKWSFGFELLETTLKEFSTIIRNRSQNQSAAA